MARPRRRRRRWLRFLLWLGIPLALLLAAPHLVALDAVRARVEAELGDQLGVPCKVGRMGFSWFSGFAVRDLEIAIPTASRAIGRPCACAAPPTTSGSALAPAVHDR